MKRKQVIFIDPIPKDWVDSKSTVYTNLFHYVTAIITYEDGSTQKMLLTREEYQEHILLESLEKHIENKEILKEILERFSMFKTAYRTRIEAEENADESW